MKNIIKKTDFLLLSTSFILMIIGIVAIYSASSVVTVLSQGVASNHYLLKHAAILAGTILASFIIIFKMKLYKKKSLVYLFLAAIVVALFGLRFYGNTINGSQSWYDLGKFSFQPSEFAKTAIILFSAIYYEELIANKERVWYKYLIPIGVGGIIALFVLLQPDLGGFIIITLLTLLIFASVPMNKFIKRKISVFLWGGILLAGIFAFFIGPKALPEYQLKRLNFWAPCTRYTEDTGYQVCNSFIAIKNGGLTGLGFGNSTQKYLYLPEAHTDFIFSIICEEAGLLGGIVVLLLYIFLLFAILRIAKGALRVSDSIIAYGTFIYISLHILINLLGVLALMPLTGVPLPLLSYGGSFNINIIVLLFMCQRIAIDTKKQKVRDKIKKL